MSNDVKEVAQKQAEEAYVGFIKFSTFIFGLLGGFGFSFNLPSRSISSFSFQYLLYSPAVIKYGGSQYKKSSFLKFILLRNFL